MGRKRGENGARGYKTIALLAAVMLVFAGMVGGTVAWLITKTDEVVNTFTYGDINIDIEETPTDDGDENPNTNTYKMVPGHTITKDPTVTVEAGSEDCWLFVELKRSSDPKFDDFMTYAIADGWTELENTEYDVYYRAVDAADVDQPFAVIKDNTVTVKESVTKDMLNALTEYPTLTVTGYAVQRDNNVDTAAEAWALVQGN